MYENREGQGIPQVTFRTRRDHEWVDVSSEQLFALSVSASLRARAGS